MKTKNHKTLPFFMRCTFFILLCLVPFRGQSQSQKTVPGYGAASYSGLPDNQTLDNWMVLGPVHIGTAGVNPDANLQKEAFDKDAFTQVPVQGKKSLPTMTLGGISYSWKPVQAENGIIDLGKLPDAGNYSIAYALAEINMDTPSKILVGLGSDDGIKVFVNGTLVYSNWIGRSTTPNEDLVILDLKKGSNQILVKVQNMEFDWSFTLDKPGKNLLNHLLYDAASNGNLDKVKLLVENGVDVNGTNGSGLTPYQIAMIRGNRVMYYLKDNGAKTDLPLPPFDKLVDYIFTSAQNGTTAGVAVLISKDGNVLYAKGFGYSDIGNKVPVTPDTKFRIGSITKQFVAASILKLQEEGKISVDDKLSKFIPDFPQGNAVTIRNLLTHTSGIHSYTNRTDFMKYVFLPITSMALVDTIKAYPYDFNPGDNFMYNNSGFFILGYILEKISGKPLSEYLKETLFVPLGMNNTGVYESSLVLDHEAYGYSYENGKIVKALNWNMSWAGGAGALYSTVRDLNTWNEAVFGGKVLNEESLKAAFTPAVLNNKKVTNYGYGWAIQDYRGLRFISHGGGLHGFVSDLERQPDNKITIVELCNSTPPPEGINPSTNASLIADYLLWPEMTKQAAIDATETLDKSALSFFTGRYDYGNGMILIVTLEGDQLNAQLTGQLKFPIFPSSENEFYWKVVEASVTFIKDEKGVVVHAVHHQGGREFEAKKLPDENPVSVDPAIFDKYVGRYDAGNNNIVVISKEGDKLYAQGLGLPPYQLLPASETEYFLREVNARLMFKDSGTGTFNSILINFNGVESTANKLKE